MELDPELLSRIQFAFVISFHILFPAFTIGLASFIAVLETLWGITDRELYVELSQFWTKIFAISFAMGVGSGIVMSFQFGTNWSQFSDLAGPIIGPLMGYEVLIAFFLEATFLGVLLFGRNRVPRGMHIFAAYMIALGTLMSAFWILSANSWMQTPAGFEMYNDHFYPIDWWAAIFNPSFPYRLAHMVMACFLTTAFVVVGVSAWFLRREHSPEHARKAFSMGLWMIIFLAPLQIFIGDLHGLNTFKHQPAKVAAMEGHWETQRGAPLYLFAVPDQEAEKNHFEIAIPKLGSLILTHELDGEVHGLKQWPPEERPPVAIVFYAFRLMVGIGLLMVVVAGIGLWLRRHGRLYDTPWFLRLCIYCIPIGFIALLAGWFVTEVGRQPWTVYGLLHRSDSLSPSLTGSNVLTSLLIYISTYTIIFGAGIYYLAHVVRQGPTIGQIAPPGGSGRRPLSGADTPLGDGDVR